MRGVTPRERRVSRNPFNNVLRCVLSVTPRERRVSRNYSEITGDNCDISHASREACE